MSRLILRRPKAFRDKLRDYKVLVDEEPVGTLREGGKFVLELAPGEHTVQCKVDWCSSPRPTVTFPDEGDVCMTVEPNGGPFTAVIQIVLEPKNYLRLTVDGEPQN